MIHFDNSQFRRFAPTYIFIFALLIRLAVLGTTYKGRDKVPYYDDVKISLNLLNGNGYSMDMKYRNFLFYENFLHEKKIPNPVIKGTRPTASKQPVYPLLVTGIFMIFGVKNFFALFILQAFLSSLTCILFFFFLKKWCYEISAIASIGLAVYPPFVYHAVTVPESTTLLLFLIALFVFYLTKLKEIFKWKTWLITGVVSGVLILTEPATMPFAIIGLCYAACYANEDKKGKIKGFFVAIIAAILVISPWTIRNYIVFGRFPLLKSAVGVISMWGLERSGSGDWVSEETLLSLELKGRKRSEIEEDEAIRRALIPLFYKNIKEYFFVCMPKNFYHFWWEIKRYKGNDSITYLFGRKIPYALLLFFALPSMFWRIVEIIRKPRISLSQNIHTNIAFLLVFSFTIVYTIFGAYMLRYHFPEELMMFIFFAESIATIRSLILVRIKDTLG